MSDKPVSADEMVARLRDHENEGVTQSDRYHLREESADLIERQEERIKALEKDAARWNRCLAVGFPVRNQTAHSPDWRWVTDNGNAHGPTPTAAIDAAREPKPK